MTKDEFWAELNKRLHSCIGQITVPRMEYRDADIIAVHEKLLELAGWVDESLEEMPEDL